LTRVRFDKGGIWFHLRRVSNWVELADGEKIFWLEAKLIGFKWALGIYSANPR